jgi:DNA repair exonuclease SbcCD nuclease subunit
MADRVLLPSVPLAHLSDSHLGYEAFAARSPRGRNQRGEDVVAALRTAVDQIVDADPPVVVHSGDLAESPQPPILFLIVMAGLLSRLAGVRPDGTRRQLVVIAGNHDTSPHLRHGCYLDLFARIPGVHVVSSGYEVVRFDPAVDGCDPVLADLAVHALPHDTLKDHDTVERVHPTAGAVNVLVAHGVAESSALFRRAVGREFTISADVLLRPWDYVALGHWHRQGPVTVTGGSARTSRIWYAGSTEHIDFGDARGEYADTRGWLQVTVHPGGQPTVTPRSFNVRPMVTLPPVDGSLGPDEMTEALRANLRAATIDGAVVRQRIFGVHRDVWCLVDTRAVLAEAGAALHYRLDPVFARPDGAAAENTPGVDTRLGSVAAMLRDCVAELVPDGLRDTVAAQALELCARAFGVDRDELDPDPDTVTDPDGAAGAGPAPASGASPAGTGTADDQDTASDHTPAGGPVPSQVTVPGPAADAPVSGSDQAADRPGPAELVVAGPPMSRAEAVAALVDAFGASVSAPAWLAGTGATGTGTASTSAGEETP